MKPGLDQWPDLCARHRYVDRSRFQPFGPAVGVREVGTVDVARQFHKFVVIDFDRPTARVYLGSDNFSNPTDRENGENLLLIRIGASPVLYMIEAPRIFDHYHFRVVQKEAKKARRKIQLRKPPRKAGEEPWWLGDYSKPRKIRDRELFS